MATKNTKMLKDVNDTFCAFSCFLWLLTVFQLNAATKLKDAF